MFVGLLLGVHGCDCGSTAESHSAAVTANPSDAPLARHPLAGSWSGSAQVPTQGIVAGVLTVDDRGLGTAVLTVRGVTVSESFRIESWNGRQLRATHRGSSYSVSAELDGSVLHAELPTIGLVRLTRR